MLEKTSLDGVIIVEPKRFQDDRGFFSETWNRQALADVGIELDFLQDNHSLSVNAGTVRGLHYQSPPHAQAKLVRVGRGSIRDVAVDARVGSPTYGDWVSVDLSAENGRQLLVPSGYLHGFVTQEPNTEVNYKCTDYYVPTPRDPFHASTCVQTLHPFPVPTLGIYPSAQSLVLLRRCLISRSLNHPDP